MIASLNIKGFTSSDARPHASNKWLLVNQVMRDKRIGVLAVQETHLSEERKCEIENLFDHTLKVYSSPDPARPSAARGVAIVLNKRLIKWELAEAKEVIPGRALEVAIPLSKDKKLRILTVYAPNDRAANALFWREVQTVYEQQRCRPDVMLGDMNYTDHPLDRLPARTEDSENIEAFRNLIHGIDVVDGWRLANGQTKEFTFNQPNGGSMSRIDRAYISAGKAALTEMWNISLSAIPTDHKMISFSLANYVVPFRGKGRWMLLNLLIKDDPFRRSVKSIGIKSYASMKTVLVRTPDANPQIFWRDFKGLITEEARSRAKKAVPKAVRRCEAMKEDVRRTLNKDQTPSDEARAEVAILEHEILKLEARLFASRRASLAAKDWCMGEKMSRYWMMVNAPKKEDQMIYEMFVTPEGDGASESLTRNSRKMAEGMKAHYDGIQLDGDKQHIVHSQDIARSLANIENRMSRDDVEFLDSPFTRDRS